MIKCPNCSHEFQLEESLFVEQLEAYKKSFQENAQQELKRKDEINLMLLNEKNKELQKSYNEELVLRKKLETLETKEKSIDLIIQKKIQEEKNVLENFFMKKFQEEYSLKILEKEKKIQDIELKLQETQRVVLQNSQQTQGESFEKNFLIKLQENFLEDSFKEVPIGRNGADIIHTILYGGISIGKILWECKQTKSYSQDWVLKLEQDVLMEKAIFGILVTKTLPKNIEHFQQYKNIYVVSYDVALIIFKLLRESCINLYKEKKLQNYKSHKIEFFYKYITGVDFKNHLSNIFQTFLHLKQEIEKEKIHQHKYWSKQEKLLESAIFSSSKISGDIGALTDIVDYELT
jgi:hypothetical protein